MHKIFLFLSALICAMYFVSPALYLYLHNGAALHLEYFTRASPQIAAFAGRFIVFYNRDDPMRPLPLALPADLGCTMRSVAATRLDQCRWRLQEGEVLFGPYLALAPGRYAARYAFGLSDRCPRGRFRVDVLSRDLSGITRFDGEGAIETLADAVVELNFAVDEDDATLSRVYEFRVHADAGCGEAVSLTLLAR
jgi:hypothetical protein